MLACPATMMQRVRAAPLLVGRPSAALLRAPVSSGRRSSGLLLAPLRATEGGPSGELSDDDGGANVAAEYCSIDPNTGRKAKRSLGELEQEYLAVMSSWYFDGKPIMTDEEFEVLKDELIWGGSKIMVLDSEEKIFVEAAMAFAKGKPIMSDSDYDALKASLKTKGSIVAAEGPRCSIRSKKMYSDATADYIKMTLLNVPSALFILGILFGIDVLSGFEVTSVISLPPPYGVALLWGLLLPTLFVISYGLTQVGFKDSVILKGPCPNCGTENFTYFGDIFTVPGNRGQNSVECTNCKAGLTFDEYKRIIVVDELPEERIKRAAAAAAKKAAAAAKKKAKAAASASADN